MPMLLVGNLLLFSFYGGVVGILLPIQVENVDASAKETNLGIITGIGAVVATLFNPGSGALSDRTRSRSGRRDPYLLGRRRRHPPRKGSPLTWRPHEAEGARTR